MKRITTYLLGLVLVVCGCSVDDSPVPVDPNPGVGGMTFVVNLPDPNAGPSSYALSDEDESKVTSIYVFAFSKNEVSGKYLLVDYSENSGTIETDPSNPRKKTFRVSFTRLKTGD